MKRKRKIRIKRVSAWCTAITAIVVILYIAISGMGNKEFYVLKNTTEQYIECEKAAEQLQEGSDYLTEQVRLYVMTGEERYLDQYIEEVEVTKRRENAVKDLSEYFKGSSVVESLQTALTDSKALMETEYYAMRLRLEATSITKEDWPEEIQMRPLSGKDRNLSNVEKIAKAQEMVSDERYETAKAEIEENITNGMDALLEKTKNRQARATTIFTDMFRKLEIGIGILAVLIVSMCVMMQKLIVRPLLSYNESIARGEIFPVIGAAELQNLAETYNQVYQENQETQRLIRHQAEHDALTDTLNRGSFERVLHIYETGDSPFALILIDVDIFKSVNDTYGHAVGDIILKSVTSSLKTAFRSIDYVCRIGGDEFAIVMVEMTSDLKYTIEDKLKAVGEVLAHPQEEGVPPVTLSVGIAFSDRENPGESIFKDADQALYKVKENGRNGYEFY